MEGPNVIYRISLAMLRTWRRDLLALDFEGNNFMGSLITLLWNPIADCYKQYFRCSPTGITVTLSTFELWRLSEAGV